MMTFREFLGRKDWLADAVRGMTHWRGVEWNQVHDYEEDHGQTDGRKPAPTLAMTEVIGSRLGTMSETEEIKHLLRGTMDEALGDMEHVIAIDLDHQAILIPSSTPGHHHLIVDLTCPWGDYVEFLKAAAQIGLIEEGYLKVSLERGETHLRAPWIRKGHEHEDVCAAVLSQLTETDVDGDVVRERADDAYIAECELQALVP